MLASIAFQVVSEYPSSLGRPRQRLWPAFHLRFSTSRSLHCLRCANSSQLHAEKHGATHAGEVDLLSFRPCLCAYMFQHRAFFFRSMPGFRTSFLVMLSHFLCDSTGGVNRIRPMYHIFGMRVGHLNQTFELVVWIACLCVQAIVIFDLPTDSFCRHRGSQAQC